ncbi:Aste57867_9387 [Aphanomyces stellatus]|uniref:Aste57867_9387 protein n=1 Tax=Aphanomyces stellatus TaxID=120398 RepID=A0A485KMR3_9STRA|nr:hypothetical protein As57867_009351 [Aphanomyces stellatus]VFT86267.1 Aste57867_9387 [Aphanomyces stellatus]
MFTESGYDHYPDLDALSATSATADRVEGQGTWTPQEHKRFLEGVRLYPHGPWKCVATIVRTRTVRQIRTHAQKFREKMARHERGMRSQMMASPASHHHHQYNQGAAVSPKVVVHIDPFNVNDQASGERCCWWEPLASSCSPHQFEESLVFLTEAFAASDDNDCGFTPWIAHV